MTRREELLWALVGVVFVALFMLLLTLHPPVSRCASYYSSSWCS